MEHYLLTEEQQDCSVFPRFDLHLLAIAHFNEWRRCLLDSYRPD